MNLVRERTRHRLCRAEAVADPASTYQRFPDVPLQEA